MAIRYPKEVHAYIREHEKDLPLDKMAEDLNARFGTEFTYRKLKSYYQNHKLHVGARKECKRELWTPDAVQIVEEYIEGRTHQAMAELLTEKTGRTYTAKQVLAYCKRYHLHNGFTGHFEKGRPSRNKGLTWDEIMSPEAQQRSRATCFKVGDLPHNYAPVGSISRTTDGFLIRKVKDTGKQHERWEFVHRLVYEENFGTIPEGCIIIFKDGNRENCSPENLMLVTMQENAVMNKHGYRSTDPNLTEVGLAVTKVKIAITQKRRRA